jgi:hypothetical protein
MKLEIIDITQIKNHKIWDCESVLVPTADGIKFIDDKSQKIVTDLIEGLIKINDQNGIQDFVLEKKAIGYFDKNTFFILIN